jgi:hypothetical protein
MSFFKSKLVQEEIQEISNLQNQIYSHVFSFSEMSRDEKLKHVDLLEELLKKQQILYTRLSLSDDPEAKTMRENILNSAKSLGFNEDIDLNYLFRNMESVIESMRDTIKRS